MHNDSTRRGAMGLKYLDGKQWANITRDERFFCLQLYNRIIEMGTSEFVRHLRDDYGCDANPDTDWELGFEVCFYRDLWQHRGRRGDLYSPKRTFDLALFSDEAIIVIEAKAQQAFDDDQLLTFVRDREQILKETEVGHVFVMGLCSSKHPPSPAAQRSFDGTIMTWGGLARHFDDDPHLYRADDIYDASAFDSFGRNNQGGYMTGLALVAAFERGERFFVGRNRGLLGPIFAEDIASGSWRTQKYETNRDATLLPNSNWFLLEQFVRRVNGGT